LLATVLKLQKAEESAVWGAIEREAWSPGGPKSRCAAEAELRTDLAALCRLGLVVKAGPHWRVELDAVHAFATRKQDLWYSDLETWAMLAMLHGAVWYAVDCRIECLMCAGYRDGSPVELFDLEVKNDRVVVHEDLGLLGGYTQDDTARKLQ